MQIPTEAQLYPRGHTQPTEETQLEHPAQVTRETVLLGTIGHLLHKATLLRPGDKAALPNT